MRGITGTEFRIRFFEKAHWAVWTMDLSDYTNIEQVGKVFWRNARDLAKVLGHHAGQIVRDEAKGRWIVLVSSRGGFGPQGGDLDNFGEVTYSENPPVDVLYDEVPLTVDLLSGVRILAGKKHPVNALPRPTEGKWDPGITRIDDRWYFAYVIAYDLFTDFLPALARSPIGADHTQITFMGTDGGSGPRRTPSSRSSGASGACSPPAATTSPPDSRAGTRCTRLR